MAVQSDIPYEVEKEMKVELQFNPWQYVVSHWRLGPNPGVSVVEFDI